MFTVTLCLDQSLCQNPSLLKLFTWNRMLLQSKLLWFVFWCLFESDLLCSYYAYYNALCSGYIFLAGLLKSFGASFIQAWQIAVLCVCMYGYTILLCVVAVGFHMSTLPSVPGVSVDQRNLQVCVYVCTYVPTLYVCMYACMYVCS